MSVESDKVFSNIVLYLYKIFVFFEELYDKYYEKVVKYILKGIG